VEGALNGLSVGGRLHPMAWRARRQVEVFRGLAYGNAPHQRLDIYRPKNHHGQLPCVFYVHGGGFRICSKESHWMMAMAFASRGYLVFNVEYARGRYPHALADLMQATEWVSRQGPSYQADLTRLALAGESAGANLITALTTALAYDIQEEGLPSLDPSLFYPRVVMPACGILQVSDPDRFTRANPNTHRWVTDIVLRTTIGYLGKEGLKPMVPSLADPLVLLEADTSPNRPLPKFFITCGGADVLLDDSKRLAVAVNNQGASQQLNIYPNEGHAFHAFIWRENAKRCWRDHFSFLETHLLPL
jgi:acetyl esterase